MSNEETQEVTKKPKNLIDSYKRFSSHTLEEQLNSENNTDDNMNKLTQFLKDNRNLLEVPVLATCTDYYELGCKTMQTGYLIDFIISAIFGASIGLIFTPLLNSSEYWIFGIILGVISLSSIIVYLSIKKYQSKI